MNNATHEKAAHPVSALHNDDEDDGSLFYQTGNVNQEERPALGIDLSHQLNQLKYQPRAETIRKILRYSNKWHKK